MKTKSFRFKYPYSKFWLIFWMIIFLPIGMVLLSRLELVSNNQRSRWVYDGNRFWLHFWAIFLFPVSILLLFLKGTLVITDLSDESVIDLK